MKLLWGLLLMAISSSALAQTKYPLGNGLSQWGLPIGDEESDLNLRLGARLQSLATTDRELNVDSNETTESQDFFIRRARLQMQAKIKDFATLTLELRNDNSNKGDEGERQFNLGDTYVDIPLNAEASSSLRLYRAKVDVSRTQTVSSSELIFLTRPKVADEAAQYVNHNRRASNIQLIGNISKKMSYQFVAGDGVHSDEFSDAKGNTADQIEKQNFMVGAKLRFHPFSGWEDLRPSESYLGEGKHFSFGVGAFNTSNINFVSGANKHKITRNLLNAELSTHYYQFALFMEYFKFQGVVEDLTATELNQGTGEGGFVQLEWVFPAVHYLAPFFRHEKWNRMLGEGDWRVHSNLTGLNWYLNGNRFKMSLAYEQGIQGKDISGSKIKSEAVHFATMWHF